MNKHVYEVGGLSERRTFVIPFISCDGPRKGISGKCLGHQSSL